MSKKIVRGIIVVLMIAAIIIGFLFIFKSKPPKNEYKTTVNFENINEYDKNEYSEPAIEENIIEYTQNNYIPLILTSFGAFVVLLVFYAFLSRKKGW
ncbi:MAG: hypothetical protein IJH20_02765 [Bacilli bacterium]|nr:hypothetical protein [Bacilli bacterium]